MTDLHGNSRWGSAHPARPVGAVRGAWLQVGSGPPSPHLVDLSQEWKRCSDSVTRTEDGTTLYAEGRRRHRCPGRPRTAAEVRLSQLCALTPPTPIPWCKPDLGYA